MPVSDALEFIPMEMEATFQLGRKEAVEQLHRWYHEGGGRDCCEEAKARG